MVGIQPHKVEYISLRKEAGKARASDSIINTVKYKDGLTIVNTLWYRYPTTYSRVFTSENRGSEGPVSKTAVSIQGGGG